MTIIRTAMARLSLPCRGSCHRPSSGTDDRTQSHTDQSAYEATSFHDNILDVDERKEIARLLPYLEDGERVLVVARQSRLLPGATLVFTPNVVYCTVRRTIIRSPMMLGLREHIEYYRHRDVKSVRLVRGRFTSSLMLTVPGMGTAARSAYGEGDGTIAAIPHAKADEIYRIIQRGEGDRRRSGGSKRPGAPVHAGGNAGDRTARNGADKGGMEARQGRAEAVPVSAEAAVGGAGTA